MPHRLEPRTSRPQAGLLTRSSLALDRRTSKLLTFTGCASALAFMTVVSVAIGQIFHAVPASFTRGLPINNYVAIASFLYFGVKSLLDAREIGISGEDNAGIAEEREDAEETLKAGGSVLKGGWPLVRLASKLELMTTLLAKPTRLTPPPLACYTSPDSTDFTSSAYCTYSTLLYTTLPYSHLSLLTR